MASSLRVLEILGSLRKRKTAIEFVILIFRGIGLLGREGNMKFDGRSLKLCLILLLMIVLTACGNNTPPKGFAPSNEIVRHAIARKLTLTEDRLTAQLDQPTVTDIKIQNLKIQALNPLYIADLPTYLVSGTYTLKLNLPRQEVTQNKNEFEVYLQRQAEGKTWRLLIPDTSPPKAAEEETDQDQATAWASYLVT